ncbi:hypothetical protein, partial [Candidatus Binatus sp.]
MSGKNIAARQELSAPTTPPIQLFHFFTFPLFTGDKSNRDTRREILPAIAVSAAATALSATTAAAALSAA